MLTRYNNKNGTMPHPLTANDTTGLLCIAPMEDPTTLLVGYRYGIFPWESFNKLGVYFFPTERYLIDPRKIEIPKSMRSYFNQNKYSITIDQYFVEVMHNCRHVKRKHQETTWINSQFQEVYGKLHEMGYAHSFEVWQYNEHTQLNELVGGLYGVAVGKIFTGESMFSTKTNASKFAMIYLAKYLQYHDFQYIDCQVYNDYLSIFGGFTMHKKDYFEVMKNNLKTEDKMGVWHPLSFKALNLSWV